MRRSLAWVALASVGLATMAALLAPSTVHAQTEWQVTACDGGALAPARIDSLLRALALEVDGSLDATVTVALDCPGPSARVTVHDARGQVRVTREVALTTIAEAVRERVIALVVANAIDAARALPEDAPPPEPLAPEPTTSEPTPPPSVTTALASPRVELPPVTTELGFSVGARVFVAGGATALATAHLSVRWEWLVIGAAVAGAPVGARLADVDVVVPTLQLGAVARIAEGSLEGTLAVLGEGGVAVTSGRPRLPSYVGTTEAHPVIGGLVRLAGAVRLERALSLGASIDVGGIYGVQVAAGSDVVAFVHGLSIGAAATVSWAP